MVARFDYDPYGQAHQTWHSGGLDPLTYQPIRFDFLFTGHLHQGRSGLYIAPYRAYDPELGRWISRDPIDTDGGINLYEYVGGDPINWVDLNGWRPKKINFKSPGGGVYVPTDEEKERVEAAINDVDEWINSDSFKDRFEDKYKKDREAPAGHWDDSEVTFWFPMPPNKGDRYGETTRGGGAISVYMTQNNNRATLGSTLALECRNNPQMKFTWGSTIVGCDESWAKEFDKWFRDKQR